MYSIIVIILVVTCYIVLYEVITYNDVRIKGHRNGYSICIVCITKIIIEYVCVYKIHKISLLKSKRQLTTS